MTRREADGEGRKSSMERVGAGNKRPPVYPWQNGSESGNDESILSEKKTFWKNKILNNGRQWIISDLFSLKLLWFT